MEEKLCCDSAMNTGTVTVNIHKNIIPGDIDGDGNVTVTDALMLIRAVTNARFVENGDVNGDGKVGLVDVIKVMKSITQ